MCIDCQSFIQERSFAPMTKWAFIDVILWDFVAAVDQASSKIIK